MSSAPAAGITVASDDLPKISHGRGVRLWDVTGKSYIDGSAGPAVYSLGHAHPEINEAIKQQLDKVAHGYRFTFTSDPLEELTAMVAESCGGDLSRMVFVTSGSEAIESCLKIALHYQWAIGERTRRRIISRERSWHGNTLGALSISGFLERRVPYEGALIESIRISPVNAYRPIDGSNADTVAAVAAAELDAAIQQVGAHNVAAFVFEPVVGAAGGVVPAPPGYARLIREVCDRHGVLMIADEVMCGSGRVGTWRALEHDGVLPDIMSIAKGLAGGYVPLGAAIYSERIHAELRRTHGGPLTGHTFTGHTLACAAGVAVQRVIRRDNLLDHVRSAGLHMQSMLRERLADVEQVGDVRGRGFFVGIELVADPLSKEPFAAEQQLYLNVRRQAMERGLICYPCGGNVDGIRGDTVILSPPYNATLEEVGEIIDLASGSIRAALQEVTK